MNLGSWMRMGSFSLAERIVNILSAVLVFSMLTRGMTQADFGAWTLFMSIFMFLESSRNGMVQASFLRHGSGREEPEYSQIAAAALVMAMAVLAIFAVAAILAAPWVATWTDTPALAWLTFWIPLLGLASLPRNYFAWILQSKSMFKEIMLLRLVQGLTMVVGLVPTLFLPPANFLAYTVRLAVLSALVASLLALWQTRGLFALRIRGSQGWIRVLLRHGRFSMGTMLGSSLYKGSDALLIGGFLGPEAVALYGVASRIADYIEVPIHSLANVLVPRLSQRGRNDPLDAAEMAARATLYTSMPVVLLSLGLFLLGGVFILVLAGETYLAALPILWMLAVFNLMRPLDRYLGILLDAIGRPDANLLKVLVGLATNVTGNVLVLAHTTPRISSGAAPIAALVGIAGVSIVATGCGVLAGDLFVWRSLGRSQVARLVGMVQDIVLGRQDNELSVLARTVKARFSAQPRGNP